MIESVYKWFSGIDPVLAALIATTFTWLLTAFGAATVFFWRIKASVLDGLLGFVGGVMVAASCFGLLIPAIEIRPPKWECREDGK